MNPTMLKHAVSTGFKAGKQHGVRQGLKSYKQQVFGESKGQTAGVLDNVLTIGIAAILIIVMVIVYAEFEGAISITDHSTQAQTAFNNTNDNTYSGFELASVLPIVLAGVGVLLVVIGAFSRFRGR